MSIVSLLEWCDRTQTLKKSQQFTLGKCWCGCGNDISLYDNKRYRLKRFRIGHTYKGKIKKYRVAAGHGYYFIRNPEHHFARKSGYIFEHRLIWEQYNNAILLPWANVHHINGKRDDNRIENLEAMMDKDHDRLTRTELMVVRKDKWNELLEKIIKLEQRLNL